MRIYLTRENGTLEITGLVSKAGWSGDNASAARKMTFSLVHDEKRDWPVPEIGAGVTLEKEGGTLFQGYVIQRTLDSESSVMDCVCYDKGLYLKNNDGTYKFRSWTPEDIAATVCADRGLPVAELAETGVKITRKFSGVALDQIVRTAYSLAAGQSLAAQATTAGVQAAGAAAQGTGLVSTLRTAAKTMAKDPQYWASFITTVGGDYEQAKADGASELSAYTYATVNSLINALVEIGGGGIDELPDESKGFLRNWVETMLDEGKEEVIQGAVAQLMQNVVYAKGNGFASLTDENAVINPGRMLEEFLGGAVVGGVLGGAQLGANSAVRYLYNRQAGTDTETERPTVVLPTAEEADTEAGFTLPTAEEAERADTERTPPVTQETQNRTDAENGETGFLLPTVEETEKGFVLPTAEEAERANADIRTDAEQVAAESQTDRAADAQEDAAEWADAETVRQAERISKAIGREVVFYTEEATGAGIKNGYYSPADGKIHVNTKSKNPVAQIIAHELTHSMEMAESYGELSKIVLNRIQESADLGQIREYTADLYARNGVELRDAAEIDQEIVAEYVEEYLFSDEESILKLTRENRTLAERIRQWLDKILAKLGNKSARERQFLTQARDLYAKALSETQEIERRAQTESETKGTLQALREAYARGEISEEEFDTAMDGILERESGNEQSMLERSSITELPDGKKYVRADRQVIFGNDPQSWSEQLEDYINGKIRRGQDVTLMGADGDALTLTATSAGKLSDNHTSDGRTMSDTAYERKVNAATHIDELAEVSVRGKKTVQDQGGRHGDMASGGWNYRTAFFQDFDGKYYEVTISVAQNENGKMVYNIGQMQERSASQIDGSSAADSGALRGNASFTERVAQPEGKVNRENGEGRYSYGGTKAKNANLDTLRQAQEMEKLGADAESVHKATGWHKGADGKWRFEIDDSGMEFYKDGDARLMEEDGYRRLKELTDKWVQCVEDGTELSVEESAEMERLQEEYSDRVWEEKYNLTDFVKHDELFEQYPKLRGVSLVFKELSGGEKGYFEPWDNTIVLSDMLFGKESDVVLHEIQHVIQEEEGFSGGSSPMYWAKLDAETGAVKKRIRQERAGVFRSLTKEEQNDYTRYKELERELERLENAEDGTEDGERYIRYDRESDELYLKLWGEDWFQKLVTLDRKLESGLGEEYNRLYRNTAGEIEARDTANRRTLTAEERRSRMPDTGNENTVFVEDAESGYSIEDENRAYQSGVDNETEGEYNGRNGGAELTEEESGAVLAYKSSESYKMNAKLRDGIELTAAEQEAMRALDAALEKLPVHEGTAYRTLNFDDVFDPEGELDTFKELHEQGAIIKYDAYTSASVETDGYPLTDGAKYGVTMEIISENARDLAGFGNDFESEVLFKRETVFAVRSVSVDENGYTHIVMEEVQDNARGNQSEYDTQERGVAVRDVQEAYSTHADVRGVSGRDTGGDYFRGRNLHGAGEEVQDNARGKQSEYDTEEHGETVQQVQKTGELYGDLSEVPGKNPKQGVERGGLPGVRTEGEDAKRLDLKTYAEVEAEKYSVSEEKEDILRNLRGILNRGGDAKELKRYVSSLERGEQNSERVNLKTYAETEAEKILDTAHSQGLSVDEYLRENWERYEYDGGLNEEARQALELEKKRYGRRYSVSEENGEDIRETLPAKAREYLNRTERYLTAKVGNLLSVPKGAQREVLQDVVQEISREYLKTGEVSQETMDDLFEQAYSRGVEVDSEFYDTYKPVKDYLRTTAIDVGDKTGGDIPDFDLWRQSAFGTLRLVNKGGIGADTAYMELRYMAPELFPPEIDHPSDQLLKMYEVGKSVRKAERSLDEAYGSDAAEFKRWAKRDFDTAINDTLGELRKVKRYADERAQKTETETKLTLEEVTAMYGQLKNARKTYEKAAAKNLLTQHDEIQVGRLLRGEIEAEHLDPKTDNVQGIRAVYEARQEYEKLCKGIREWNETRRAKLRERADQVLETANDWKDKKAGILYSRETMERNIRDIVEDPKLAEEIVTEYITPVHDAQAKATRLKNKYRDRVRALNLSQEESRAVQILGEAEDSIRMLEDSRGRMETRDGKTLEDWKGEIDNLWLENPGLNAEKIKSAVKEFREIYDELFQKMNETRISNGYEPIQYRSGYFPHFQNGGSDSILGQFGKAMGIDMNADALPTTINGMTHTFKPGIQWFGNALQRTGFETEYDAVEGFDRYIEGAADVIYQTENIQKLRALATQARYRTGDDGIRAQVDKIQTDTSLNETDKQNRIDQIYKDGKFALSNFVVELDEYTNLLANKKSRADRNMEQALGRRMYGLTKKLEGRVAANMVAVNPASWLTNFVPLTQGGATLDRGMLLRGMWDTLKAYKTDDGIVDKSTFLTNRRGSDPIVKTWSERASAKLSAPMEYIDQFTADSLIRARYQQNIQKGLSEDAAMSEADAWAAGVMADRSKGSMPTVFNRSDPLTKVFTQFQLEVNNQLSYLFKDLPREMKDKGLKAIATALIKFFVGAFLYNEVYEYVIGRRCALDPLGILNDTVGDLTGYELPNLIELGVGAVTGDMPSFETEQEDLYDTAAGLASNVAEELPFIGGILGGGRVPISSALPDWENLGKAVLNDGWSGKKRLATAEKELGNPLTYMALPFGGGQIKKVYQGLKAVIEGGSYSVDSEGNDILQYPVYNDSAGQTALNTVGAVLFGKTSLPTGQEWAESGFQNLSAKETACYQAMTAAGIDGEDAFETLKALKAAEKTETESESAAERKILREADISGEGKSILYYGLMATEKEREAMDALADGGDMGTVTEVLMDLKDTDGSTSNKLAVIARAELTDEEEETLAGVIMGTDLLTESGGDSQYAKLLEVKKSGLDMEDYAELRQAEAVDGYLKYLETGIGAEAAKKIAIVIAKLEPEEGKKTVSAGQKWRVIVDSGLTEEKQLAALEKAASESQYLKFAMAAEMGVTPEAYVTALEALPEFDADGNGSYNGAEVKAALESFGGSGVMLPTASGKTTTLTNEQKAVLWQLITGSTSAMSNPFSVSVGREVIGRRG